MNSAYNYKDEEVNLRVMHQRSRSAAAETVPAKERTKEVRVSAQPSLEKLSTLINPTKKEVLGEQFIQQNLG
jgi:hypothetical protein